MKNLYLLHVITPLRTFKPYYLGFIQGFEFEFWQRGCAPADVEVGCVVVDYETGEVRFVLNKFPNQTSFEVLLIMFKLA